MRSTIASMLLTAFSVVPLAADELTFTLRPPSPGEAWSEAGSVESTTTYRVEIGDEVQEGTSASTSEFATSYMTTAVDGDEIRTLSVSFVRNRSTIEDTGVPPNEEVSPLEGNSYAVEFPSSGVPMVRRSDGTVAPDIERDLVLESVGHLARPNRLSSYLAGLGTIEVGDALTLPPALVREAWSSDLFVAKELEMRLERIAERDGSRVGVFDVEMQLVNPNHAPYEIDARIRGAFLIEERGGRIVETRMSGPVETRGEWGDDPKIRLEGVGTLKSESELTQPS